MIYENLKIECKLYDKLEKMTQMCASDLLHLDCCVCVVVLVLVCCQTCEFLHKCVVLLELSLKSTRTPTFSVGRLVMQIWPPLFSVSHVTSGQFDHLLQT